MLAFTDTIVTHDDFLASMRAHREADRLVPGRYWAVSERGGRGCAIGCAVQTVMDLTGKQLNHQDHAALAAAIGVPESLLQLQDIIFEGLPESEALDWPIQFAEAITPGADLSDVSRRVAVRILREIVLPYAGAASPLIRRVAEGLDCEWSGDDTADRAYDRAVHDGSSDSVTVSTCGRISIWATFISAGRDAALYRVALRSADLIRYSDGTVADAFRAMRDILLEEIPS